MPSRSLLLLRITRFEHGSGGKVFQLPWGSRSACRFTWRSTEQKVEATTLVNAGFESGGIPKAP